ncbi:MAG: DUF4132 domain-containing protein [Nocardiopsaceae bacterium]|nr:DUF4132 domain-containing protein [Nocardiopsaceae bacterium]
MTDILALVEAAKAVLEAGGHYQPDNESRALPEVRAITTAPDGIRRECILLTARQKDRAASVLLPHIAGKRAGLTVDDVESILSPPADPGEAPDQWAGYKRYVLFGQFEATWKSADDAGRARLRPLLERLADEFSAPNSTARTAATQLRRLISAQDDATRVPYELIGVLSAVAKALRRAVEAAAEPGRAKTALVRLLSAYPVTGKAKGAWHAEAATVVGMLREPGGTIAALLGAAFSEPGIRGHTSYGRFNRYGTERDEAFLCGAAVLAGQTAASAPELLPQLRRTALEAIAGSCRTGGPGGTGAPGGTAGTSAPGSIRLANHCVAAIADAGLPASVTELRTIERGTGHGALVRAVRKSLDALAAAQGLTSDQLLETAVEDHGLGPDGTRRVALADGWAAVAETDGRTARIGYEDPGGTPRASLPAAVRQASADALAALKKDLKAIRATVAAERIRLDGCLVAGRHWPLEQWRRLYLGHPVTGQLTRGLIWTFRSAAEPDRPTIGIPVDDGTLLASDGAEVPIPSGDETEVRLWHPVRATADDVRDWRRLLLGRRIAQPVKQAFREVYVLTPAEEATRDYSNRFAGHFFRQDQARALLKGRSWKPVPLAPWDDGIDHGIARREYPQPDGRVVLAELFFDMAGPEDHYDITRTGMYRFCVSDQVRFSDPADGDALPLASVPPLTFSEAMRDIDLVIGVSSIGADPEWLDRGEARQFGDYWSRFAFGDLGAGAEVRREVIAALVPALAIADRCELEDRFLKVRGDLRTYRIHLGSGNVLMSPNDQYLCIVSVRNARASKLFLPFDDDPVLSLILSKAFLLADDTKITDPSITRQIAR